jgi:hypothetical protein
VSEAAAKHQVAVLNSSLKLLNRLAVPAVGRSGSHSLTPAGKWWACQAAAAAAAFGAKLADAIKRDGISSSSLLKLESAGLSLAARGLLFVSRSMQECITCATNPQHKAQQYQLTSSILSSCMVLHGALDQLNPEGRGALPDLQLLGSSVLDQLVEGVELDGTGLPAQQVLTGVAGDLERFSKGVAAQVPASFGCNYPGKSSVFFFKP